MTDRGCPPGFKPGQRLRGPQDLRCLIGWLGEQSTIEAFQTLGIQAERWPAGAFHVPRVIAPDSDRPGFDVQPDLWLPDEAGVVEVKSSMLGRRYYAPVRQAEAYRIIHDEPQDASPRWPINSPRVIYAFVAFKYARTERPTVQQALNGLEIVSIILVDLDIAAAWLSEVGAYGRDWRSKHTGAVIYENFHRLTVKRAADLAKISMESAFAAQKEAKILRLESEIGRSRRRGGEKLVGPAENLCFNADFEEDWPLDVGF